MYLIQKYYSAALLAFLLLSPPMTQANPVACFTTNMGNFCIELFETQTPITTANFLSYINSGAYTNGIFHRSVPGFVIQGGGFKIVDGADGKSLATVNTFAPIANEFKLSNTRGTVAMAKAPNDPNSATSQWFVNLADNSLNLDSQNGGFTVFGRVIFDGMKTIDAIENLPVTNLGGNLAATPTIDFDGSQTLVSNFVQIDAVAVTETTGIFSEGILSFPVITETGDLFEANLRLIEDNPEFVFELDLSSITPLHTGVPAVATFSSLTGLLKIPSVMISASTSVKNVSMKLTHAESYQFTLQSYE
jgi:peptidyl-prolyl cis-trans isomerase A (cyclophilin A)